MLLYHDFSILFKYIVIYLFLEILNQNTHQTYISQTAQNKDCYMKLYSFRRCPFAIRARMTLNYSQISYELIEVDIKNKTAEFLNLSPKGTVPVLQVDNHILLEESLDIIKWALHAQDPDNWKLTGHPDLQVMASQLIHANDTHFKPTLDQYKYADRNPEHSQSVYRDQCRMFLDLLEENLQHNRYLVGSAICWADIAIFPFIRQFAFVDKEWFDQSPYPYLQNWLQEFLKSDLFTNSMKH